MIAWNWQTIMLAAGCVLLIVYEVLAALRTNDPVPTISGIVWFLSRRPAVPFFFGLLMGHFFL